MYDGITRNEFERLWKAFLDQASNDFGTRAEAEAMRTALLDQNDAFRSLITATRQAQGQIETLHRQQQALHAQIAALSAVCGTLARGLTAAGVAPTELRAAIDSARTVLPDSMRDDGAPAIDAVLALIPRE
ncbi:hypothetical protein [Azospirillum sp.]|uniref:hypothetical protein n=1 Tax=Azospirillum sp. TaxID=34012 RepID=UPI003D75E8DB